MPDVAVSLWAISRIPFAFVESRQLGDDHRQQLTEKPTSLRKFTFLPLQKDMRKISMVGAKYFSHPASGKKAMAEM
jgi:hypothetical protein